MTNNVEIITSAATRLHQAFSLAQIKPPALVFYNVDQFQLFHTMVMIERTRHAMHAVSGQHIGGLQYQSIDALTYRIHETLASALRGM